MEKVSTDDFIYIHALFLTYRNNNVPILADNPIPSIICIFIRGCSPGHIRSECDADIRFYYSNTSISSHSSSIYR